MPAYLADTSAWHRSDQVAERWSDLIERDGLLLCTPVRLELLYSARGADYEPLARELDGFRQLALDAQAEVAAMRIQESLAEKSQHRGPSVTDLLIAAIPATHEVTLLHYDRHFDAIVRVTGQPAEWLAKRGSLD